MSSKKIALLALPLAAIVAVVLYVRRSGESASTATATATSAASAPRATQARAPTVSPPAPAAAPARRARVRRLADPNERKRILDAIHRARQRRGSAPAHGAPHAGHEQPATESDVPPAEAEYIKESVREIVPLLSECYERALERAPDLEGQVVVNFTIEGEPEVGGVIGESAVEPDGTTIDDEEFRECMSETMYAIEIDPPRGGGTTHVTYPFSFRTKPPPDEAPVDR